MNVLGEKELGKVAPSIPVKISGMEMEVAAHFLALESQINV